MGQTLTEEERLIARVLFMNQMLKANNHTFQQLFWAVMSAKHGQEFVTIRPQGRLGDGGNDGYLPAEGHYFQVYGPIDPKEKVEKAAEKLVEDFEKLKNSWSRTTPILAYSFVFNDKYEGTFMMIARALGGIEKANPTVTCRPFTAAHMEDAFLSLPADRLQNVLGMLLPDPSRAVRVDYGVLKEVIIHIMNSPSQSVIARFGDLPELGEKIRLNNLCSAWGDLIRNGARQSGHVEKYFSKNSTFMKQALRDHLVKHYLRVRDAKPSPTSLSVGVSREDLIFDDFRQALLPVNATVAEDAAVTTLIAYYFETCDVFEQRAHKGTPNAPS